MQFETCSETTKATYLKQAAVRTRVYIHIYTYIDIDGTSASCFRRIFIRRSTEFPFTLQEFTLFFKKEFVSRKTLLSLLVGHPPLKIMKKSISFLKLRISKECAFSFRIAFAFFNICTLCSDRTGIDRENFRVRKTERRRQSRSGIDSGFTVIRNSIIFNFNSDFGFESLDDIYIFAESRL